MSSNKKIVTVFGATGTVGGSVARDLLADGEFSVRAVTRNASSEKAQALKAKGAEVVEADLSKPETLAAAVKGAYAVSGLTDFWAVFATNGDAAKSQAEEERQGKALVDAAKAANVQHFIFFTLWHSDVPHFEGKHVVNEYLKKSGLKYTSLYNAFYFENISNPAFYMVNKGDDGTFWVSIPQPENTYVPSYSAEQSGQWVLAALKNPSEWQGKDMIALGENLTPTKYAEVLSKVSGKNFKAKPVSTDEFHAAAKSDNPMLKELYLNLKYFVEHCQPSKTVYTDSVSKKAFPGSYDFETFARKNEGFQKWLSSL